MHGISIATAVAAGLEPHPMQAIEYRFRDKTGWGDGPWQSEPDKKQWQDEATGLPCLIVRGPSGALCGYVGIAEGHSLYGLNYNFWTWSEDGEIQLTAAQLAVNDLLAHGGLTYADSCAAGEPEHGICHRPNDGEPDHVWWFGFDCAHSGDLCPAYDRKYNGISFGGTYKPQAYVETECAFLAKQLKALAA